VLEAGSGEGGEDSVVIASEGVGLYSHVAAGSEGVPHAGDDRSADEAGFEGLERRAACALTGAKRNIRDRRGVGEIVVGRGCGWRRGRRPAFALPGRSLVWTTDLERCSPQTHQARAVGHVRAVPRHAAWWDRTRRARAASWPHAVEAPACTRRVA